jgi:hypothetical protein
MHNFELILWMISPILVDLHEISVSSSIVT